MSKVKLSAEVGNAFTMIKEALGEDMLNSFELLLSHYKKSMKYNGKLQDAIDTAINFIKESQENRKLYYRAVLEGYEIGYQLKEGDWLVYENLNDMAIVRGDEIVWTSDGLIATLSFGQSLLDDEVVRLATEEEIQKEKDRQKWSEIGRKVNEYKEGDIVYYNRDQTGTVITVFDKSIGVRESLVLYKLNDVKMVCPVEFRVN